MRQPGSGGFLLVVLVVLGSALVGGCDDGGREPLFPSDYASTYVEVRGCRSSADHSLSPIRVMANALAAPAYANRDRPFPVGSILIKEERDFGDNACAGPIVRWSVAQRLAAGSSPLTLDWRWQRITVDRRVETQDEDRCIGCHSLCGEPPDGYMGTCAVP